MLDDDLIAEMRSHLPEGIPSVFISSVSGLNIQQLKRHAFGRRCSGSVRFPDAGIGRLQEDAAYGVAVLEKTIAVGDAERVFPAK